MTRPCAQAWLDYGRTLNVTEAEKRFAAIDDEIERLRAAVAPFLRYYDDIRFNLRKQPRPTDAAIEERGERIAAVTWSEFYALRDAFSHEQLKD